ncbi:MAG: hypothetical protein WCO06_03275 [Candidatus Roizmanbacteria bacterium]
MFSALLGGMSFSYWMVISKKISGNYSNIFINRIDMGVGVFALMIVSLIVGEHWVALAMTIAWGVNVGFGLIWIITGLLIINSYRF